MTRLMAAPAQPHVATSGLDHGTLVVASVVLLGVVMSILDTTVINVAVDHLGIDFRASLTTIQWVVTGSMLALATVIPIRRRVAAGHRVAA